MCVGEFIRSWFVRFWVRMPSCPREAHAPPSGGSDALRRATLLGLQRVCTKFNPPGIPNAARPTFDQDLFEVMLPKIEAFAADAAADEQLAGRELTRMLGGASTLEIRDAMVQRLPNLKVARERYSNTHFQNPHSFVFAAIMVHYAFILV